MKDKEFNPMDGVAGGCIGLFFAFLIYAALLISIFLE